MSSHSYMRRATYLVSGGDPFSKLHIDENKNVKIEGLQAAKHVRERMPYDNEPENFGVINVEFSKQSGTSLNLPFDPPVNEGLHVFASLNSDLGKVNAFLQSQGIQIAQQDPIEASEWYEWFAYDKNEFSLASLSSNAELQNASAFRITWDLSSQHITTETWSTEQTWDSYETSPTELGIFNLSNVPDGFFLNGRVRKLDSDERSKPLMFKWYPKHYDFNSTASISLAEPYGLHPELLIHVDAEPPLPICRLFAKLDLPRDLFLDQYQLDDLPRMVPPSKIIGIWGETDLEKPEWQTQIPSTSLLRLFESKNTTYKVPMHTRYLVPTDNMGNNGVLPAPYIFWVCKNSDTDRKLEHLEAHEFVGIDSVFPLEDTSFHVWHTNSVPYHIPAIDQSSEKYVESLTIFTVLLGTMGVVVAVILTLLNKHKKLKEE